jgi:hypothetical protein
MLSSVWEKTFASLGGRRTPIADLFEIYTERTRSICPPSANPASASEHSVELNAADLADG